MKTFRNKKEYELYKSHLIKLLVEYHVFYMNLKEFEWSLKKKGFIIMHQNMEIFYRDIANDINKMAKRFFILEIFIPGKFSEYLELSQVKVAGGFEELRDIIINVAATYAYLIEQQYEICSFSKKLGDNDTASLLIEIIRKQEKIVGVLASFLH